MNESFSNAASKPRNPVGKNRLNVVFAALRDMVLGEADPSDGARQYANGSSRAQLNVELLPAKGPKGAVIANALAEAISQFRYEEVQPHLDISPEDVYQVHQICIVESPENLAVLANFARLARGARTRFAEKILADFPEFDASALADVRIVKAPSHELDPVFILAGGGAQRAQIAFEFHGEFVCAANLVPKKMPAAAKEASVRPSQTGTVLPPAPMPSRVATVLPPETSPAANHPVLMHLHIQEPGKAPRDVAICKFPCRIGRSEDCDVVIESANISRTHVLLVRDPSSGHFRVVDQSKVGTLIGSRAIPKGDEISLVDGQVLTLAPGESSNPVTIRVVCPALAPASVAVKPAVPAVAGLATVAAAKPCLISRAMANKAAIADLAQPNPPAAPTLLHREEPAVFLDSISAKPVALLHVHYGNGNKQTCEIADFPFVIGREPDPADNAFSVNQMASKVSRQHLRIDRLQAGVFNVQNLALGANGTWFDNEKLQHHFTLAPSQPGQGPYLLLGDKNLGLQSAAICVELL